MKNKAECLFKSILSLLLHNKHYTQRQVIILPKQLILFIGNNLLSYATVKKVTPN